MKKYFGLRITLVVLWGILVSNIFTVFNLLKNPAMEIRFSRVLPSLGAGMALMLLILFLTAKALCDRLDRTPGWAWLSLFVPFIFPPVLALLPQKRSEKSFSAKNDSALNISRPGSSPTICDICSMPLDRNNGFVLTTEQVTTDKNYWTYIINAHSFDDERLLLMYIQQQAMQINNWLICRNCSPRFSFDKNAASRYASMGTDPPGIGPTDVNRAAAAAALAWQDKYKELPSWAK